MAPTRASFGSRCAAQTRATPLAGSSSESCASAWPPWRRCGRLGLRAPLNVGVHSCDQSTRVFFRRIASVLLACLLLTPSALSCCPARCSGAKPAAGLAVREAGASSGAFQKESHSHMCHARVHPGHAQERTTRCVVVRSTVPGVFCAGADLKVSSWRCWGRPRGVSNGDCESVTHRARLRRRTAWMIAASRCGCQARPVALPTQPTQSSACRSEPA